MGARFRLRWQKIVTILIVIIILVVVIALIIVEIRLYGTGFAGKTLWDWLQLLGVLAIPVVVGFGALWFTIRQGKVADAENKDNQRETALQAYIDKMSELLLHEKLRDSAEEDEVRKVARVRTLTILPRLDAKRKYHVLQFLYESGLIDKDNHIIDLTGADLREADLGGANLRGAALLGANLTGAKLVSTNLRDAILSGTKLIGSDLSGAYLFGAYLNEAYLFGANLSKAMLFYADLRHADLREADLKNAKLYEADLTGADLREADLKYATDINTEQLAKAKSLKGATMPDGSKHECQL